jgi:hypothetical protein
VGVEIDSAYRSVLNRIRAVENGVGHHLTDAHACDLCDVIVQAINVLNIEGRIDMPEFIDVEIALGIATA